MQKIKSNDAVKFWYSTVNTNFVRVIFDVLSLKEAKGSSINHVDMEGGNQMYILLHKPCLMKWSIKVKRRSKISKKTFHMVYG